MEATAGRIRYVSLIYLDIIVGNETFYSYFMNISAISTNDAPSSSDHHFAVRLPALRCFLEHGEFLYVSS